MKITLSRALKEKNRLNSEVKELEASLRGVQFIPENDLTFVEKETYFKEIKKLLYTRTNLVALKAVIGEASVPILEKIFNLESLKAELRFFQSLDYGELVRYDNYGSSMSPSIIKKLSLITRDELKAHYTTAKKQIRDLEDAIDSFNATTMVDIDLKEE